MDREEAEQLLRGGPKGVRQWNEWRETGEELPDLGGINLSKQRLENVNLRGVHLEGAKLYEAHLENAKLDGARLEGANLYQARLGTYVLENGSTNGASLHKTHLEGANLSRARLIGVNLSEAHLEGTDLRHAHFKGANLTKTHLDGAELNHADFNEAKLDGANLNRADLGYAKMEKASLIDANLNDAKLICTVLKGAFLRDAKMEKAKLYRAELQGADLVWTILKGANLEAANLAGSFLSSTCLEGANLRMAIVDGKTLMTNIAIDRDTDMTGVGLGNVRIEPHIRSQLERNIRQIGWEKRYKEDWRIKRFLGPLLRLTDYGSQTKGIALWFWVFAFLFAVVYLISTPAPLWAKWHTFDDIEPFVTNLNPAEADGEIHSLPLPQAAARALYFSVVTMTTLGFGDISANPLSYWGHGIVGLQVLIGYVLLGALITRFAILFQSVE